MRTWRVMLGTDIVTEYVEANTPAQAKQKLLDKWNKKDDKFGLSLNIIDVRPAENGEDMVREGLDTLGDLISQKFGIDVRK